MTRKDFELIAEIIRTAPADKEREVIAIHFAKHLIAANPRFKVAIFLRACGVEG